MTSTPTRTPHISLPPNTPPTPYPASPRTPRSATNASNPKFSSWCYVNRESAPRYITLCCDLGEDIPFNLTSHLESATDDSRISRRHAGVFEPVGMNLPQSPASSGVASYHAPSTSSATHIIIQKSFFSKAPWLKFPLDDIDTIQKIDGFEALEGSGRDDDATPQSPLTSSRQSSRSRFGMAFTLQHPLEQLTVYFDSQRRRDEWFGILIKLRIERIGRVLSEESRKLVQLYNQIPSVGSAIQWNTANECSSTSLNSSTTTDSSTSMLSPHSARLNDIQSTLKQQCINTLQNILIDAHSAIEGEASREEFLSAIPQAFQRTLHFDTHSTHSVDEGSDTGDSLPFIPERVNHWKIEFSDLKIEQRLAEGAFGTVFKGYLFEKEVAIKKLKLRENVLNSELIEDLRKEAEILASIRHPHIILFLGITDPPEMCLVTEFMEQGNIYQVLRKNLLNDLQVHSVLMDICYGMHFIHKQKILHLDLKPANVLMSKNGYVAKVGDFGISRVLGESEQIVDDTQEGTLLYMAPELAFQRVMSTSCDVFSFGVVLYEILYLKEHPSVLMTSDGFEDDRIIAMAFDLIRELDPNTGAAPPHCPPWWLDTYSQICRDCLKQDPETRITFPEILSRLKRIRDLHQSDSWFILEETAHKLHEITKDLTRVQTLNDNFKICEVVQFCLAEFRTPTIHYYATCSLVHMSCIHVDSQLPFLQKAIVHLFEISTHSKTFFEKKGNFIYWNLLLDAKCLSITDKERVLKHALDLCKNQIILRRFMRQGALGCLTYKLDRMRNKPKTPLPFIPDPGFVATDQFHGDFFAPALFPDATRLLSMMCKDKSLTETQIVDENVIPALVSLSSRGIHDTIGVNGVVYTALECLANLLTRFPSLADLCYNLHVNPKLLASREYLGTLMTFEQVISKDKKAITHLTATSPQHQRNNTIATFAPHSHSANSKRLSLQNSTTPLPKSTLSALRSHLQKQRSKRLSLTNLNEKVEVQSQLNKILEEKNESLQLLNVPDISRSIEPRERESIIIKFWEFLKSELDMSNISTEAVERSLIHHYKKENIEKEETGIRFIKGLVQQIDEPSKIDENLYLGSEWNAASKEELMQLGIKVIVNVSAKAPNYFPKAFEYHRIQESDHMHSSFVSVCQILQECAEAKKKILLHSTLGTNRAPAYCIAFLMKQRGWDLRHAYKYVQERRELSVQRRFVKQLMVWGLFLQKQEDEKTEEM